MLIESVFGSGEEIPIRQVLQEMFDPFFIEFIEHTPDMIHSRAEKFMEGAEFELTLLEDIPRFFIQFSNQHGTPLVPGVFTNGLEVTIGKKI